MRDEQLSRRPHCSGESMDDGSIVHASDAFPKRKPIQLFASLDFRAGCPDLVGAASTVTNVEEGIPFRLLPGEFAQYFSSYPDKTIVLTNYRLIVVINSGKKVASNIPLLCIETIEIRDLFFLFVFCKDGTITKISFQNNETCAVWSKCLMTATAGMLKVDEVFAFAFHAWLLDCQKLGQFPFHEPTPRSQKELVRSEFTRLGFNGDYWRITEKNKDFKLCNTYPMFWITVKAMDDEQIVKNANFRSMSRVPAVVWRDTTSGSVLVRSSQPTPGITLWRSDEDEFMLKTVIKACTAGAPTQKHMANQQPLSSTSSTSTIIQSGTGLRKSGSNASMVSNGSTVSPTIEPAVKSTTKLLIVDARSYAAAFANRARGGGYEFPEYYNNCEVVYMGLPNVHAVRKSFSAVRGLCSNLQQDQRFWLSSLEGSGWMQNLSSLLSTSVFVSHALHDEGRPVLVHCTDGWDRTTQIVAITKLILDSHYRTLTGFMELVEREWIEFGHKFNDRNGMTSTLFGERSPVFLQWLDAVHQLCKQFPLAFEFNELYLLKLSQHVYSGLFGTFLFNSYSERLVANAPTRSFSVWSFLNSPAAAADTHNVLYDRHKYAKRPIWPDTDAMYLRFWRLLFCPPHAASSIGAGGDTNNNNTTSAGNVAATNTSAGGGPSTLSSPGSGAGSGRARGSSGSSNISNSVFVPTARDSPLEQHLRHQHQDEFGKETSAASTSIERLVQSARSNGMELEAADPVNGYVGNPAIPASVGVPPLCGCSSSPMLNRTRSYVDVMNGSPCDSFNAGCSDHCLDPNCLQSCHLQQQPQQLHQHPPGSQQHHFCAPHHQRQPHPSGSGSLERSGSDPQLLSSSTSSVSFVDKFSVPDAPGESCMMQAAAAAWSTAHRSPQSTNMEYGSSSGSDGGGPCTVVRPTANVVAAHNLPSSVCTVIQPSTSSGGEGAYYPTAHSAESPATTVDTQSPVIINGTLSRIMQTNGFIGGEISEHPDQIDSGQDQIDGDLNRTLVSTTPTAALSNRQSSPVEQDDNANQFDSIITSLMRAQCQVSSSDATTHLVNGNTTTTVVVPNGRMYNNILDNKSVISNPQQAKGVDLNRPPADRLNQSYPNHHRGHESVLRDAAHEVNGTMNMSTSTTDISDSNVRSLFFMLNHLCKNGSNLLAGPVDKHKNNYNDNVPASEMHRYTLELFLSAWGSSNGLDMCSNGGRMDSMLGLVLDRLGNKCGRMGNVQGRKDFMDYDGLIAIHDVAQERVRGNNLAYETKLAILERENQRLRAMITRQKPGGTQAPTNNAFLRPGNNPTRNVEAPPP